MKTLILNSDGTPLKVVDWRHAHIFLFKNKAEVISYSDRIVRSGKAEHRVPKIIRKKHYTKREHLRIALNNRNVLARDNHICQYCGDRATTVDHVVPKAHLKEKKVYNTWQNMVACCLPCNRSKRENIWEPSRPPFEPKTPFINVEAFYDY